MVSFNQTSTFVLNNHVSVKTAATLSGYSLQYLRRLLRTGKLNGVKIGQLWLIDKIGLAAYLETTIKIRDGQFGAK
jgi:excisionase family DNA binding protein